MSKISFGEALREARTAAGLTLKALADAVEAVGGKLSAPNITEVEKGRRSGFEADTVFALEKAMRLRAGELVQHLPQDHPAHLKVKLIEKADKAAADAGRHPVIGTVEAGRGIDEQAAGEWVNLPQECDGADGVYVVKGRSMEGAGILPHDYLVVRRTDTPADGDLVVAWTQDCGAVVKRVRVDPAGVRQMDASGALRSGVTYTLLTEGSDKDNRYPYQLAPENGDRIYAVVVAVFRTYKAKPGPKLRAAPPKGKKK